MMQSLPWTWRTSQFTRAQVNAVGEAFLRAVIEYSGKSPAIYVGADTARLLDEGFADYPLWIAQYDVEEPDMDNVETWAGWQYTTGDALQAFRCGLTVMFSDRRCWRSFGRRSGCAVCVRRERREIFAYLIQVIFKIHSICKSNPFWTKFAAAGKSSPQNSFCRLKMLSSAKTGLFL